jgi:hypothetical protein
MKERPLGVIHRIEKNSHPEKPDYVVCKIYDEKGTGYTTFNLEGWHEDIPPEEGQEIRLWGAEKKRPDPKNKHDGLRYRHACFNLF